LPESESFSLGPGAEVPWVGLLLAAAGIALLPVANYLIRTLVPERRVFFARWGFSHVARVILAGVLVMFLVGVWMGLLGWTEPGEANPLGQLAMQMLILGFPCLVAVGYAKRCEVIGWRALGLPAGRDLRALVAAVVAFVFILPVLLGVGLLWPSILEFFGEASVPQDVMLTIQSLEGSEVFFGLLIAIAIQPFLEEVLFRGFLQPLLVQNLSDRGGVVATSVLFALLHGPAFFLPVFVLSLAIGAVMLRTRRLSAAWLVHALNNATVFLIADSASPASLL